MTQQPMQGPGSEDTTLPPLPVTFSTRKSSGFSLRLFIFSADSWGTLLGCRSSMWPTHGQHQLQQHKDFNPMSSDTLQQSCIPTLVPPLVMQCQFVMPDPPPPHTPHHQGGQAHLDQVQWVAGGSAQGAADLGLLLRG
jgi:hypothetical protein